MTICNMCSPAKSLLTIADSIAIEILNKNAIILGVGNELHLHDNNGSRVLEIYLKNKIHGIVKGSGINDRKLLIYGEKEFVILEWQEENQFKERYRSILSDWIIAGCFLENEPDYVLLTAHSVLLKFGPHEALKTDCIKARVSCEDKSTLYCGHISGGNWQNLVIFGGNAFGELLIWQPIKTEEALNAQKLTKVPLLQRLTAHNGVIFSIDFNIEKNLLITTSDDRSVRFWNVQVDKDWLNAILKPAASGFGHIARVFQGKIFDYENSTYALTVGEDSYFCLWRCNGELLFKHRHQFGAVIWNFAYDLFNHIIYTVGSTGNLRPIYLKDMMIALENDKLQSLPIVNVADNMEYAAKIKFITKSNLIAITNRNRLMLFDLKVNIWKEVTSFQSFKCTVLEVYENLIAICGYKHVILYEFDGLELKEIFNIEILNNVIRSFHFLSFKDFLISDDAGNCEMLKFQDQTNKHVKYSIDLTKGKERWLTAALLINEQFLLVSNRLGNLLLYSFESNCYELKHILKHPHGFLGATYLKLLELNETFALIQSAGHDCTLKTLKIDFEKAALKIENRQNTPIAWIEDSIAFKNFQTYLGFNDNHFVVWSLEHDISLQVACGGGHRCWHFYGYEDGCKKFRIRLVFIKNKQVFFNDYALHNDDNINNVVTLPKRNHWHTRPCNVLELIENKTTNELLIISAGDDNLIKLSTLDSKGETFKQRSEIQTHISNIRALKILNLSDTKYLIFSGGGRAQLCLNEFDLQNYCVREISSFMLKSTENHLDNKQAHNFDPETRIMSIDVLQNQKNSYEFEIYLACSDGYLRKLKTFESTDMDLTFQNQKEVFYGKCLLQVRLVANKFLVTAATDGFITIFDLNLEEIFFKLQVQASGINALDIYYDIKNDSMNLLTGGDDQAVNYIKICLKNNKFTILNKNHMPHLHTAQVTAAKFSNDGLQAYSSGVDQNLIHYDLVEKEIKSITHSCIADIKGLDLCLTKNLCLLYGCGLQVFEIES